MGKRSMAGTVFWVSLAMILYSIIGFPLLCFLLAIFFKKRNIPEDYYPNVSVIVAAYNEEHIIAKKIENLLGQDYPLEKLEIIVVSDASTDGTNGLVKQYEEKGVKLLALQERTGVSEAFHHGVMASSGDILMFTDATGMFSRNSLKKLMRWFRDPKVGGVCGRDSYKNEANSSTGKGWSLYIDYENWLRNLEGRLFSPIVVTGSIHAIRRPFHRRVPSQYTNDLVTPLTVLKEGYEVRFEPEAVITDKPESQAKRDMKQRVRVAARGAATLWYMREMLNPMRHPVVSFQLVSRKVFRWFVGFFGVLLFIANWRLRRTGRVYRWFFRGQAAFYGAVFTECLMQRSGRKTLLYIPFYVFTIHLCALIGFWEFFRGHDFSTWEPAR